MIETRIEVRIDRGVVRAIIRLTGVSFDCDRVHHKWDCLGQQLALIALKKEHPRGSGLGGIGCESIRGKSKSADEE
ncbi:hypothetical protein BJP34_18610 [Moorena producens PAL-8-15-08-1]|uniref:Uncharacterized protein n=1 Tax=Moorena producens PAL-8-15-08-1 TaxID=1458985 RepID=A0A1D8TUH2_9CYAN|nr:hypothetical protein [Moorena producens]AOX01183.1 hypothetical protein BJP34_18610 [Moorena producens PAL-8-15-08-1]